MSEIIHPFGGKKISLETDFCGRKLTIETGELAFLANGAVTVRYGDSVVLGTVVIGNTPTDLDYLPLTVEYEERMYAAGKISGSRFIKREGRASEQATLAARLIDRPIRPLFPKGYRHEIQAIATVLSADLVYDTDVIAMIAISAALALSGAPFAGPIAGVKIGMIDGNLIPFPTTVESQEGKLDLTVAGTGEAIMMVEAGAKEVDEPTIVKALELAHKAMQPAIDLQVELVKRVKVQPLEHKVELVDQDLEKRIAAFLQERIGPAVRHEDHYARHKAINNLREETIAHMNETASQFSKNDVAEAFEAAIKQDVRKAILDEGVRPDKRKSGDIRPLSSKVSILPRTHGSAIFTRGTTQVLNVTTLAPPSYAQMVDTMDEATTKRFMHHYNFPPYSVGETRPLRSPGRREIGHGALAERALEAVLPTEDEFPYAIRSVSEVMTSNGSTSMASVCAGTLSLMDAGVPITKPVSGIAMGLVISGSKYVILSDIMGDEDFAGDMDFKVAGTSAGITALQMDIKVKGITHKIMAEALAQAKTGRALILKHMLSTLATPRPQLPATAPRITTIKINPTKIREVIGKGGETINRIIADTGAEIDIKDDGTVIVSAVEASGAEKAIAAIEAITAELAVGQIYDGTVVKTLEFGAFVEVLPGKEGLVHISELASYRVAKVEDIVKEGDKIRVKVVGVDDRGRVRLSKKALEPGTKNERN